MIELILLTGTIVAMSLGCTLIALILRNTVRNSRKLRNRPANPTPALTHGVLAPDAIHWDLAVRGYDTPELCREDMLAREGALPGEDRF
jgi:hypothetical protein